MADKYSANDQALGYLYQVRYALYLLLDSEERSLFLEKLDDVSFETNGTLQELLQIKHHSKPTSLTDSAPEIWKTIRIWSTRISTKAIALDSIVLTLVTTATANDDSIAYKLKPDDNRNTQEALNQLVDVAISSKNKSLKESFESFLSLSTNERRSLVNSIYVLDRSPNIQDTTSLIKNTLKIAVSREHRDGLYQRLEGWWFGRAIDQLSSDNPEPITGFEVSDMIRSIADQFKPDALPIDYLDAEPDQMDVKSDNRQFVTQLKMIAVQSRRIEKAIIDYYRAFEQRSRWVREDLLIDNELEKYERKLIDEWERYRLALTDKLIIDRLNNSDQQDIGRQLFNWMEQTAEFRIRPNVTEPYVMRGSYHILADKEPPPVWWHPKFIERLSEIIPR